MSYIDGAFPDKYVESKGHIPLLFAQYGFAKIEVV
jgi:hypothetical protein